MDFQDRGVSRHSDVLVGKTVGLGVCGGIGAVEVVKLIRELRRYGARVRPFFTPNTPNFITEMSVGWAAGCEVIGTLSSEVDHLEDYELVLIAPATLNTIAKCALALADNPVTLLVASQLGRKRPLFFVPTMNLSLHQHPKFSEYCETLKVWGAGFYPSPEEEGRLKMPNPVELSRFVVERLSV